jgi:hypothetical protein
MFFPRKIILIVLIVFCFTGIVTFGKDYVVPIVANGTIGDYRFNVRIRSLSFNAPFSTLYQGYTDNGGFLGVGCSASATRYLSVNGPIDGRPGYSANDVCTPFNNPEFGWIRVTHDETGESQVVNEFQIHDRETKEVLDITLIPAVVPARKFLIPAIDGGDFWLSTRNMVGAYAIVNPSETETATIEMRAHRHNQPDSPGCIQELTIPPLNRVAGHFRDFFPDCNKGSTMVISGDIPIAVGGLQVFYPEFKMTALPVETIEDSGEE